MLLFRILIGLNPVVLFVADTRSVPHGQSLGKRTRG